MATIHVCDKCGKKIEGQYGVSLGSESTLYGVEIVFRRPVQTLDRISKQQKLFRRPLDLCDDCLKEFKKLIPFEKDYQSEDMEYTYRQEFKER